jgi:hypothetical protein
MDYRAVQRSDRVGPLLTDDDDDDDNNNNNNNNRGTTGQKTLV